MATSLAPFKLVAVVEHVPAALGVDADDRDADVSVGTAFAGTSLAIDAGVAGEQRGTTADE
jgi:hypothetical protein